MIIEETDTADEGSDELLREIELTIDPGQQAERIDKFLSLRFGQHISRTRIQSAIHAGNLKVNGQAVKPNYRIRPADKLKLVVPRPESDGELLPENIPLEIVFEDDHVLLINKPAGLVVHPGPGNWTGTLANALLHHFQHLPKSSASNRPGLLHRIDKDTSGLMIVAKSETAMAHLAKQFFDHTIERKYVALVWGDVQPDSGIITGHIGRHLTDRMQFQVFEDGEKGKHAVTHYKVLERLNYVTLVECRLETGRTHQIRVHMKHIGHTLFNDERYGGNKILKGTVYSKYKQFVENCFQLLPRHALHAQTLGFVHPATGKKMHFEHPLPEDMQAVIEKWRSYWTNPNVTRG